MTPRSTPFDHSRARTSAGLLFLALSGAWSTPCTAAADGGPDPRVRRPLALSFERLPDAPGGGARFATRLAGGLVATIDADGMAVHLPDAGRPLVLRPVGGVREVRGEEAAVTRSHHLIGRDRAAWRRDVPHYRQVRQTTTRPGVDLVHRESDGGLELVVEIAPGVPASTVEFGWSGADSLHVDEDGGLVVRSRTSDLRQAPPRAWQIHGDVREPVAVSFRVDTVRPGAARFGFDVVGRDPTLPLVIDPVLQYATLLGGSALDRVEAVAVDNLGFVYVTGRTRSPSLPSATNGPVQGDDAFVSKLDSTGSTILWTTYVGGSGSGGTFPEGGVAIEVDALGRCTVAGNTNSTDFPIVTAMQPSFGGVEDAFAFRLSANGSSLDWSTYLGGERLDAVTAMTRLGDGSLVLTGGTDSAAFPKTPGALQGALLGSRDAFLTRLGADGALVASTYLGGPGADAANDLARAVNGELVVAGLAGPGFPTTAGTLDLLSAEGFVTRLAADLSALAWSSTFHQNVREVAVDPADRVYVAGATDDFSLPTTFGSHQPQHPGSQGPSIQLLEAFLFRLSAGATAIDWGTYWGSSTANDSTHGLLVDDSGSPTLLIRSTNTQTNPDSEIGRAVRFDAGGSRVAYEVFVGPSRTALQDAAVGPGGDLVVVGYTGPSFPVTPSAAQNTFGGGLEDGFVASYDVQASQVAHVVLVDPKVTHGGDTIGKVVLDGEAPPGGAVVQLQTAGPIGAPASVVVPAGTVSAEFSVTADLVPAPTAATVTAAWQGSATQKTVEVWHGPFYTVEFVLHGPDSLPVLDPVEARAMNRHGDIAGTFDDQGFRRRLGQPIELIPGTVAATDIADDGRVLVVLAGGAVGVWDGVSISPVPLNGLKGPNAFADDGSICGGQFGVSSAWLKPAGAPAFVLPSIPGGTANSVAVDLNDAGLVCGYGQGPNFNNLAFLYTPGQGTISLGTLSGIGSSQANAVSEDGTVVGWSNKQRGIVKTWGFRWTATAGMTDLPPLPGDDTSIALGVGPGDVVVGTSRSSSSDQVAVRWGADGVPASIPDMLAPSETFETRIIDAWSLTDDGTILAEGKLDSLYPGGLIDGDAAFVLRPDGATSETYGEGTAGTLGVPALSLSERPVLCTSVDLVVGNSSPAATQGFLLAGAAQASIPFQGGTLLVAAPIAVSLPLPAGGHAFPAVVPCNPNLIDKEVFLQSLVVDPGAPLGVAFSRGLHVTLR